MDLNPNIFVARYGVFILNTIKYTLTSKHIQEKMINISQTNDNFPDKVESFKLFLAGVVNVSSCVESEDFSRSPF